MSYITRLVIYSNSPTRYSVLAEGILMKITTENDTPCITASGKDTRCEIKVEEEVVQKASLIHKNLLSKASSYFQAFKRFEGDAINEVEKRTGRGRSLYVW